eukprot:CAMPEP_0167761450 /NCGR_PEP_ID=MMETSP0110_2-20121227/12181_1 /TAXON_ID=629695 /ORGANISM="Gymnochlora sp., Strain CCMP2014" /LENGTH=376 /DNA_ID=CAMNT_0007648139 /DNA_START=121 /DNA_END=1251 /DNA_ORIENTATION=-
MAEEKNGKEVYGPEEDENHGVVLADKNQIITHCNSTFVKLTGYNLDDVIGKNCRILQGKNTSKKTVDFMRSSLQKGKGCQVVILNYRKNGSPFWNMLSIQPLMDEKGSITKFIGIQIPTNISISRFSPILPWKNGQQSPLELLEEKGKEEIKTPKKGKKRKLRKKPHDVSFVAETLLPTDKGKYRVRAYKDNETKQEIMCIIWGKIEGGNGIHVRCHDQCFTSEVLGSLKCDCKQQLDFAMKHIRDRKSGMVIYLPQEGRGMGLAHKIKAYSVQERGYDTVDANLVLGFPDDSRTYGCVPGILQEMNIKSIRLMTNNPRKIAHLEALGVKVLGRVPVVTASNQHSSRYLLTKHHRQGHMDLGIDAGNMPQNLDILS